MPSVGLIMGNKITREWKERTKNIDGKAVIFQVTLAMLYLKKEEKKHKQNTTQETEKICEKKAKDGCRRRTSDRLSHRGGMERTTPKGQ